MINQKLMVSGADYFADTYEINPYYNQSKIDVQKAKTEHNLILDCFKQAGIELIKVDPPKNCQDGVYTANCRDILTLVLRDEWGFEGLVMSDWYSTGKGLARPELAIAAGNDLIMPGSGADKKAILNGLKKGTLAEKDLKLSAARIVRQILRSNVAARYSPDDFE